MNNLLLLIAMPHSKNKSYYFLFTINILMVFFLILLSNLQVLPLRAGDFAFFAFLLFLFALYRPSWMFLFFVGTLPLENINIAPESLGIAVRPYQFLAALTIIALLIRFFGKKLNFTLPKWRWFDLLSILIVAGGFLSLVNASEPATSFKLAIILASFAVIYFLTRIYIQTLDDLKKIIPFFLSSSLVIVFYGIWQNVRFIANLSNFEAMPGRPNATFTEPEWLGAFLIVLISSAVALISCFSRKSVRSSEDEQIFWLRQIWQSQTISKFTILKLFFCLILSAFYLILIITVSRSAWLGAVSAVIAFLTLTFFSKILDFKSFIKFKLTIVFCFLIGLSAVYLFHLTNFQLFNRAQSTASGLQKITISCDVGNANLRSVPENITDVSELAQYNCRHINLEEIDQEKADGKIVQEIFRNDPNVNTRKIIYQKSWQEIKKHPILGIGWGSINRILGTDERGTPLNASNVFLEIWLGSGVLGFLAFAILLGYIFIKQAKDFLSAQNLDTKIFAIFILSALSGLVIFNLFNSGILLAFLWVFLGISLIQSHENRH